MSFTITITQTQQIDTITRKEWRKLNDVTGEYGYVEQVPEKRNETVEIYKQTVDDLKLVRVIGAVNMSDAEWNLARTGQL